jgi:ubiquinone/menaquinone biosynthesis C-methylase UbiE
MGNIDKLPDRNRSFLLKYIDDMSSVITEIKRVLKPDGFAILVIGDSNIRGVYVKSSCALEFLAKEYGFRLKSKTTRSIPTNKRYLPPPSSNIECGDLEKRMSKEIILTFTPDI